MLEIIEQAKAEFYKIDDCSCIIISEDKNIIFESNEKGIKPLVASVSLIKGAAVADKIIGKAAALVCVFGGAKAVFGHIMSESAQAVLKENNIDFAFNKSVDYIINRLGTDMCPMEKLVMQVNSPIEAFKILSEKVGA